VGFATLRARHEGSGSTTYVVSGNTISGTHGDGIRIESENDGIAQLTVTGNALTGSGASNNGQGIVVRQAGDGSLTALIANNTVSEFRSNGIHLLGLDTAETDGDIELNAAVLSNTTTIRPDGLGAGLFVEVGDGGGTSRNDVCVDVLGNMLQGSDE
jgi:hypothetical protein